MRLEKVYSVTLSIANPVDYCAELDRHLAQSLQTQYVGRCFMGAFIVGVKRVLRTSACRIVATNGSGEATIDVQFVAEVVALSRGDLLAGVEIVTRQTMVTGLYDRDGVKASVTLRATRAVDVLDVGQRVSVRVLAASHAPMAEQIAVDAEMLTCDGGAPPVFRLHGALEPAAARTDLAPLVDAVLGELRARAALVAARRHDLWFYELLLYAYRAPASLRSADAPPDLAVHTDTPGPSGGAVPPWEGPPALRAPDAGQTLRNALDIALQAIRGTSVAMDGFWSRPLALYRSSPLVAVAREAPIADHPMAPADLGSSEITRPGAPAVVRASPAAFVAQSLYSMLSFLVVTREMVDTYDSLEVLKEHRLLWTVMRSAQLP